jgi:beta-glucosidase
MNVNRTTTWVAMALVGLAAVAAGCSGPKSSGGGGDDACALPIAANLDCADPSVQKALQLVKGMTLAEKVQQMSGPLVTSANMFEQETNARLGIPGLMYMDGPRGVRWWNSDQGTTVYPVAAARGATWNLELERRIGKGMAKEMRFLGRHILLAPTINQVSHPRWGRAQESYGEDSFLLGAMGASFVAGVQHDPAAADPLDPNQPLSNDAYRIMACVKHFAANNIEDTRIEVNAVLDERTLREVYLPHFKKVIDAGAASVMSSYNRINGAYAGYSTELLRKILKTEWGFDGFVISDWNAIGQTVASPAAGLDVEMPFSGDECPDVFKCQRFYGQRLVDAVAQGRVDEKWVNESVLRILTKKIAFGVLDHELQWTPWLTRGEDTQALAHQAAVEGIVLLKNGPTKALSDDVLPLNASAIDKVTLIGKYALTENMGDKGSSDAKVIDPLLVFTPYEGIQAAVGATNTSLSSCDGPAGTPCVLKFDAVTGNEAKLAGSDVLVVVTGFQPADLGRSPLGEEGEWKDRKDMQLIAGRDLKNVNDAIAVKNANPGMKLIVVLKGGGSIIVKPWVDSVDGLFMAWYAGMQEGVALAELMFGLANPSGKLVQSFPAAEADLPAFQNATTGDVPYDYYHGYRWLDRQGKTPTYHFGYGLSYTTFAYSTLVVQTPTATEDGEIRVKIDVTNTGPVKGSEVVQAYVGFSNTSVADKWGRPVKELKAFARVADLEPNETRTVELTIPAQDLAYWDVAAKAMKVEKMEYELLVGPSADASDANLRTSAFTIQ